jgi:2-methylaconitate cis-trans-isomerase PrpF
MTGELFPTGERSETLEIGTVPPLENLCVQVTLIDAANPFVFVDSRSLPLSYHAEGPASLSSLALMEAIRCAGAVKMGLATDSISAGLVRGTPKIAVVCAPPFDLTGAGPDIKVQSFSMGKPHPTLQLTGAVCLASAISTPGTIPHQLSKLDTVITPAGTPPHDQELQKSFLLPEESMLEDRKVKIQHASGNIDAVVRKDVLGANVESVSLSRTARRIFSGNVLFDI